MPSFISIVDSKRIFTEVLFRTEKTQENKLQPVERNIT